MNKKTLIIALTLTFVLVAVPAFSQGRGVGSSVRSGAQSGMGSGVRSQTPAANAGSKAPTNVQGKSADAKMHDSSMHETSDFASRIESNSKLAAKIQALLPPDATIQDSAQGFKNQGLFIAALHVSHNLNIAFADLKEKMTGPDDMSLGDAIKALRPDMTETETNAEVKKAEKQTKETEKS